MICKARFCKIYITVKFYVKNTHSRRTALLYLDKLILLDVPALQTQHTSLRIEIDRFHSDGQRRPDAAAAGRTGCRLVLHLPDRCAAHVVALGNQIVCMPHVLWFLGDQRHRPDDNETTFNWKLCEEAVFELLNLPASFLHVLGN